MDRKTIVKACALFALALSIGVYASGFTWRQVLFGILAVFIWQVGENVWSAAFPPKTFTRMQFRITVDHLAVALQRSRLYETEESQAASFLYKDMLGHGAITFTWLENELFFMNTTNHYSSTLKFSIDLPSFGARAQEYSTQLCDTLELRLTTDCYELVLLTREQRYSWPDTTRDKGLVLLSLPYEFFWAFQGRGEPWERNQKATAILDSLPNMKYRSDPDVPTAWDYYNEYISLHWWSV